MLLAIWTINSLCFFPNADINFIVNLLKSEHQILAAKTGEQALKLAHSENQPDLILLDIMMPDMDGFEVCRRLKAEPRTEYSFLTLSHHR